MTGRSPHIDAIRERVGDLEAYAGVRLVTLGDGHERGVRLLQFRSGGGVEFDVVVDRSFDIGRLAVAGETFSWHSPTGLRAPWLLQLSGDRGQGYLRGFSGFLTTCGLDHIRQPETVEVEGNPLHPNGAVDHPLHGHGTYLPGCLLGYGMTDSLDGPALWCEGEMRLAMVFGDCLSLRRRITCPIGGTQIILHDSVENIGAATSPHMLLYHVNLGYPLIDAGSRLEISPARQIWQNMEHDPFATFAAPCARQSAELSVHEFASADQSPARCGVVNPASGASMEMSLDPQELPFCQFLRLPGRRLYAAAIEPCTAGRRTQVEAARHGEVHMLEPGERRDYTLRFSFVAGRRTAIA